MTPCTKERELLVQQQQEPGPTLSGAGGSARRLRAALAGGLLLLLLSVGWAARSGVGPWGRASGPGGEEELPHPVAGGGRAAARLRRGAPAPPRALDTCGTCLRDCPALARVLKGYRVQPASAVPARFELGSRYTGFYAKYINVMGIAVLSSGRVCDCTLQKAAWIVHGALSHVKRRKEALHQMILQNSRVSIMARSEETTDVPEHSDLTPKAYWDERARGLGATPGRAATSGAAENVMCDGHASDSYFGENILFHEFVHGIARTGFQFLQWDGKAWDDYNGEMYRSSLAKGLWKNTYAATNKIEYFAEASQTWFDANLAASCCSLQASCNDGIHNCVNTPNEMRSYDPGLYRHLAGIWEKDGWRPGKGTECGCAGTEAELVEGFVELDGDGNVKGEGPDAGGTAPTDPPGADDDGETIVPVEPPCSKVSGKDACLGTEGCTWEGDGDGCAADCVFFQSRSACLEPGSCAWHDGACHTCLTHKDTHHFCEDWAASGECTKNPGYMKKNCKLSCTEDDQRHCQSWASSGECAKNPGYMLLNCQSACSCKKLNR